MTAPANSPRARAQQAQEQSNLRSVHTTSFAPLLSRLGVSLLVSTYQAGKLIVVRADGGTINTHFRMFDKPMGMAVTRDRVALGTAFQIWELRNVPAVAQKLDPPGKHDACYLPRDIHITGDIDIHEMAYIDRELWFVNTRFSCLCTLDREHSFVPRWRPPFVTGYDLSDRCHLNGLGPRGGKPKYVTALGTTDTAGGWRENKADGGILMDIESDEFVARGLSMPHSPRWYADRLWVLESGLGSLAQVDLATGDRTVVAEFPGFTRGLDFWGEFAFIGLSQVRETAVFGGIPIARRLSERICGVWVVNIRTGQTVAFLRFEEGVREIFAVRVVPGFRFPEAIDWDEKLLATSFVLPDEALQDVVQPTVNAGAEVERSAPPVSAIDRHLQTGNEAYHNRDLDAARQAYERCLAIDAEFGVARYNLGVVHLEMERWQDAIAYLKQVVTVEPHHADAFNNLGIVHHNLNRLPEAVSYFRQAIAQRYHFPDAHFNLGMTLLQAGEFEEGFLESEWRWQTQQFTPFSCPKPKWDGSDLTGKSILVHTEQGAGDAIQFIRYVPILAQQCEQVLLCAPENLLQLFETADGIDRLFPPGDISLSLFDTYVALMSLPHWLQTTLDTVPVAVPYLGNGLTAETFQFADPRPKIGFVWGGSTTHKNDRNRSAKIRDFLPILQLKQFAFYSLQKGPREADLQELPDEIEIVALGDRLEDFADTARAISQLDLVISVDTAVAHLAGALAKPVWTLLCYSPDWRWLLDRDDTPWYPTMRLFRQPREKDWRPVVERIVSELQNWQPLP